MMLILRLGTILAPDAPKLPCSGCTYVPSPGEIIHITETDPARDLEEEIQIQEVTTWCKDCCDAIKSAALKFRIPIEYDFVPTNVRYVPEEYFVPREDFT